MLRSMTDTKPVGTILSLSVARGQRAQARLQTLARRAVSARLYAAWNIGRARYLIRQCEELVETQQRPGWSSGVGILEDERDPLT